MCEQSVLELPPEPASARRARTFVVGECRRWALQEVSDDLVLPVSELVTNAVLHARTAIALIVSRTAHFVEIAVRDRNRRAPVVRPVRLDVDADIHAAAARSDLFPADLRAADLHVGDAGSIAAGRGLHIVDAVADEWGVSELADGKDVWFRIATPASWRPPVVCPCEGGVEVTPGGKPLGRS